MRFAESFAARRAYFAVAGVVLLLDQLTKIAADVTLQGRGPVRIIPGVFDLIYSRNRGGLFGFFSAWSEPWRGILLTAFPLVAILLIGLMLARTDEPDRSTLVGLALILGGATGNLIDRVARGEVVDFLDVYVSHPGLASWLENRFRTAHWPTFNLADSAIVTGAALLLLDVLRPDPAPAGRARPDAHSGAGAGRA